MSLPLRSLLYAADRYPRFGAPENRLTEIFAEVLRTSPKLVHWLAGVALKTSPESFKDHVCAEVTTQFQLDAGAARPDIRVTLEDYPRGIQRTFYIEDKLDADFTEAQKQGYTATRPAPIVLVARSGRPDAHVSFLTATWDDVAREAWRLGFEAATHAGLDWPDYAWTANAPSEVRMLAELVFYLEREIGVSSQAGLTDKDLCVLPDAHGVISRWNGLFELIREQLAKDPGERANVARIGSEGLVGPLGSGWDLRLNPPGYGWPALHEHWQRNEQDAPTEEDRFSVPSLLMSTSAPWDPNAQQVPSVGVGMTIGCTNGWPDGLKEDDHLHAAARADGFALAITGGNRIRVFQTKSLADLSQEPTLQAQADEIVEWARQVLEKFKTLGR